MILKDYEDVQFEYDDDRYMKIFKKSNYRNKQRDTKDSTLKGDDTNMKIYSKGSQEWSNEDRFTY